MTKSTNPEVLRTSLARVRERVCSARQISFGRILLDCARVRANSRVYARRRGTLVGVALAREESDRK